MNGAKIITIPAAFTKITGQAHWHILTRARAIETGCFVIAPNQYGKHPGNTESFGNSLIIDPWGKILAQNEDGIGFIKAQIDLSLVDETRNKIPNLKYSSSIKK